ncbi:type II restriction endonuclease [Candidatus Palauibacter polyketidifaciens]|uniref:type II restriction endonuclease n=1 Tax=Candidatus Palauibacter polyketidifaciens TaxID=3056740 RepID=UPI0023877AEB|nr:type II restriction endonuclease [Candidatus Palauibacter polyketidifaciens]MDE2719533.1 type II restriction endonuclease [Candidatus Palauibacter polyketidifaciens]
MKRGELRDYFLGIGAKYLSAVDAEPKKSNQHEIGVTALMREQFLGSERRRFVVRYVWLGQGSETLTAYDTATYYDTRENQPHRRPEWRLYYPANAVTESMNAGDTLFLGLRKDGALYFIVCPRGSTSEQQLSWLFGVRADESFVSRDVRSGEPELGFAAGFIFDELGIEFEEPYEAELDSLVEGYGTTFPKTAEFSELARRSLFDVVSPEEDPDAALLAWLDHEEALFRCLERRVVADRIERGFVRESGVDVDGFLGFSLSVQNRRKSRMGHSLENHVEAILVAAKISYVRGAVTEHNHRPDFLFPDSDAYHAAPAGGSACLAMLGVKSTCKERWRQVLAEAEKIPRKHLLTLEPGISEPQTHQMDASNLQLVVPRAIHASYTDEQQGWLWSLGEFIRHVERAPG